MAQNISVPDIGDFKDVEVIEVLVKPGDQINKNDPIVTIESDKSSVEIPSPTTGEIKDLKVKIGDKVSEGSVLAIIENGQAASASKEEKIDKPKKEIPIQEKPKTNGEVNPVKQVKKVFAEPASKDDIDPVETNEWIDSLNSVIENDGSSRASFLLNKVVDHNNFNHVSVLASWYGLVIVPFLYQTFGEINIDLYDVDEYTTDIAKHIWRDYPLVNVHTADVVFDKIDYKGQVIINTSCEHMMDMKHITKDYKDKLFVLQSNDNKNVKWLHINCVNDQGELAKQAGLTDIKYGGSRKIYEHKRIMVIGK